jgi:hypothetical protein
MIPHSASHSMVFTLRQAQTSAIGRLFAVWLETRTGLDRLSGRRRKT